MLSGCFDPVILLLESPCPSVRPSVRHRKISHRISQYIYDAYIITNVRCVGQGQGQQGQGQQGQGQQGQGQQGQGQRGQGQQGQGQQIQGQQEQGQQGKGQQGQVQQGQHGGGGG